MTRVSDKVIDYFHHSKDTKTLCLSNRQQVGLRIHRISGYRFLQVTSNRSNKSPEHQDTIKELQIETKILVLR